MIEVRQKTLLSGPAIWMAGWLLLLAIVFHQPLISLVKVWHDSKTFNHGFMIFPLFGWFTWRARHQLLSVKPRISWLAALLGVLSVLVELLGAAAHINVLRHIALAGLLLFGVITFIGWRAAWKIWFPLSLLAFVPPLGEELVPAFQQITADFAVWMLQLTGIPVYRDGLYITIPTGHFEVAEACSGIRFFIACVFLGYLIACLRFSSVYKRAAFVAFSVALPVLANGFRVYGTIIVGHAIDMKYAAGVDHLVYGWFFFLLVILIQVAVGNRLGDSHHQLGSGDQPAADAGWQTHSWRLAFGAAIVPILLGFVLYKAISNDDNLAHTQVNAGKLLGMEVARGAKHLQPVLHNPSGTLGRTLYSGGKTITVFIGWYDQNLPDAELVSWQNRTYDFDKWSAVSTSYLDLPAGDESIQAAVLRLVDARGQRRALVYWYQVPGMRSYNSILIKLRQAINTLSGQARGGALITISIPVSSESDQALASLLERAGILTSISSTIEFK